MPTLRTAWLEQDRTFLSCELIANLDETIESDAETQWNEVIDRCGREIEGRAQSCAFQTRT